MKKDSNFLSILKWGFLLGAVVAAIEVVKNYAQNLDITSFGSVISIAILVITVLILYSGIKEVRERTEDDVISYPKAFGVGVGIVFLAFIVVLLVLTTLFSVHPKFLQNVNDKNQELYYENLKKDSVTTAEVNLFLKQIDSLTSAKLQVATETLTPEEALAVDSNVQFIMRHYLPYIQNGRNVDSTHYTLGNFNNFAKNAWVQMFEKCQQGAFLTDSLTTPITQVVISTANEMENFNLHEMRYQATKNEKVFTHTNPLSSAIMFSFSLIIYGLFCNLFVALYLYRKKEISQTVEETATSEIDASTEQNETHSLPIKQHHTIILTLPN